MYINSYVIRASLAHHLGAHSCITLTHFLGLYYNSYIIMHGMENIKF